MVVDLDAAKHSAMLGGRPPRDGRPDLVQARIARDLARQLQLTATGQNGAERLALAVELYQRAAVLAGAGAGPSPSEPSVPAQASEAEAAHAVGDPNAPLAPDSDPRRLAAGLDAWISEQLAPIEKAERAEERAWLVSALKPLGLAVAAIMLALSLTWGYGVVMQRLRPLATPEWAASSRFPVGGCVSPEQECAESPHFFVHTNTERRPWVVFDLKSPRSISKIRVTNRDDCCVERALPLVVSVSDDNKHWREVARRTEAFDTWEQALDEVSARWIRLQLASTGTLHLKRVELLP